jgi:hypothetical protein
VKKIQNQKRRADKNLKRNRTKTKEKRRRMHEESKYQEKDGLGYINFQIISI